MRLTKRGEYGLRTLIRLGVAARLGSPVVSVARLAEAEQIPAKFLENILADLKSAGYVDGVRGKHGGAKIVCDMATTKMGELVRFIDGKLAPLGCASETAYRKCDECVDAERCGTKLVMRQVRDAMSAILDHTTIADVNRSVQTVVEEELMYYI